jgi:hypothetical protein
MNDSPRFNYRGIPGKCFMWSDAEGISWAVLADGAKLEMNDAAALLKLARQTYIPERKFRLLLDVRTASSVSEEVREIAVSDEFIGMLQAMAIVVESSATRMIANFFIRFNRPRIPTRIFTTTEAAKKWLMNELNASSAST